MEPIRGKYLIVTSDRQKRYLIFKGIPSYLIDVIRIADVEEFLTQKLDRFFSLHEVPPLQMVFDFGEDFNWWWYDDAGHLHPNESDYGPDLEIEDEDFLDDDYPF